MVAIDNAALGELMLVHEFVHPSVSRSGIAAQQTAVLVNAI